MNTMNLVADHAMQTETTGQNGLQNGGGAATWPLRDDAVRPGVVAPVDWPGHSCGIRQPDFGENPLSFDEAALAVRLGLVA